MTDGVSPEEWVALNELLENPAPPPGWLLAAVQSKGETVKDEDYGLQTAILVMQPK